MVTAQFAISLARDTLEAIITGSQVGEIKGNSLRSRCTSPRKRLIITFDARRPWETQCHRIYREPDRCSREALFRPHIEPEIGSITPDFREVWLRDAAEVGLGREVSISRQSRPFTGESACGSRGDFWADVDQPTGGRPPGGKAVARTPSSNCA